MAKGGYHPGALPANGPGVFPGEGAFSPAPDLQGQGGGDYQALRHCESPGGEYKESCISMYIVVIYNRDRLGSTHRL